MDTQTTTRDYKTSVASWPRTDEQTLIRHVRSGQEAELRKQEELRLRRRAEAATKVWTFRMLAVFFESPEITIRSGEQPNVTYSGHCSRFVFEYMLPFERHGGVLEEEILCFFV